MSVLILDIGSSSVRALLFDVEARPIPDAFTSRDYQFANIPAGAATIDAHFLQSLLESCIDDILQHPAAKSIQVVGMATLVGNLLGLNANGKAITPIYTYADTRSNDDVKRLQEQVDVVNMHQRTGCKLHTAYHPARLHWLKRTRSERWRDVTQWVDLGTYFYQQWFGESPCSYSLASWSGLLHRERLQWDVEWLSLLQLGTDVFPQLADYDAVQIGLTPAYAKRWQGLQDVPFCLAISDGAAANVGAGAVDDEHVALTLGTTAAMRRVSTEILPPVPDGLWSYRIDARHHLIGGATSEGGNIFQWALQTLALPLDQLDNQLAQCIPDGHGLTFLPLLAGERSPGWQSHATGSVSGIRLSTTALDLLQAAMEGVALRLAVIAEQLEMDDGTTVMAGGGALSASMAWVQMIASALNRPLHLIGDVDMTARGTAILALRALGLCSLSSLPPSITQTVEPVPNAAEIYRKARERQIAFYRKIYIELE